MQYEKLVKDILKNLGGKENVNSVTHCITRLRFKLKDENIANTEYIKKMDGVVTVMQSGGQYQVVIGNHVPEVYEELIEISGITGNDDDSGYGGSVLDRLIDILSGVFQPVLGVLCATGMIKGFLALFSSLGLIAADGGTYMILNAVGDCLFYFFPIFIGFTAAKKFKLNQFVGMAIGAALVYPTINQFGDMGYIMSTEPLQMLFSGTVIESPIYTYFMGIPVIVPTGGYFSTVIPVILSCAAAAPLEKWLKKVIPSVVRTFIVPFLTLLIIVPLSFLIIGPVASWLAKGIGGIVTTLYGFSPVLTGVLLGGVWQVLVIFGLHWGLVPIALSNILTLGQDYILALAFAASFAQTGAIIGVALKTKDEKVKSLCIPSIISGVFGVTEPAIYGISLPRKKPFIASCIGAAIGGGLMGIMGAKSFIMGGLGIFAYPSYINPNGPENFMVKAIIVSIVGAVIGLVLTYIFDKDEEEEAPKETVVKKPSNLIKKNSVVYSPLKGEVIELSEVSDAAFSSGAIGKGVAIIPEEGKLYAPADGTITTLFETQHAWGFTTDDGTEIIIHIGMDTVQLGGRHFKSLVKQGDKVKKGQLLQEFDIDAIKKEGFSIVTPVIVTNYANYLEVTNVDSKKVNVGDDLIYTVTDNK